MRDLPKVGPISLGDQRVGGIRGHLLNRPRQWCGRFPLRLSDHVDHSVLAVG